MSKDSAVSSPPRVWLIASTFEPRGSSLYTLRLASHLSALGWEVQIICENDEYLPPRLKTAWPIHAIPRLRSPLLGAGPLLRLAQRTAHPPDIIHSQTLGLERIGDLLAEEFDRPHLLTAHHLPEEVGTLDVTPEDLSAIIAVSPSIEQGLVQRMSVPTELIRMIPSGVEISSHPKIPMPRDKERVPIVGTASVLEPSKGVMYFLMAADLILSAGQDVEFVVAGGGPEEEFLRRAARHMDIEQRVTFVPNVSSFAKIIENYDVFVAPNIAEGVGSIVLEAMSLGKPVVVTRAGGTADFFEDGEHAMLIEKANHVVLADKIESLLDFPNKARQLALRGQGLVRERFTAAQMGDQTARLYRDVLTITQPAVPS
jgi:glycosyltransferase involved in cell wall biosynthesis